MMFCKLAETPPCVTLSSTCVSLATKMSLAAVVLRFVPLFHSTSSDCSPCHSIAFHLLHSVPWHLIRIESNRSNLLFRLAAIAVVNIPPCKTLEKSYTFILASHCVATHCSGFQLLVRSFLSWPYCRTHGRGWCVCVYLILPTPAFCWSFEPKFSTIWS